MKGTFLWSLVATDVFGMDGAVALGGAGANPGYPRARSDPSSVSGADLGIDTDNDSAFINETLQGYCREQNMEFTRSRAYQKNDQAWIEEKNGSVIRRFVGYRRFSGLVTGQCLARLYGMVRLYVNYFQPSFKLRSKIREVPRSRNNITSRQLPATGSWLILRSRPTSSRRFRRNSSR